MYFTGNPCPAGHVAERYTSNGSCVVCAKQSSSERVNSGYFKKHYEENKDRILSQQRQKYHGDPEFRRAVAEYSKRWMKGNREKVRHIKRNYKNRRRAKKRRGASYSEVLNWLNAQEKICYWCGTDCFDAPTIDHYEPLSKGGEHELYNLVVACRPCNVRKSARDPYEFAKDVGRLF